jgi:hypothetical protein
MFLQNNTTAHRVIALSPTEGEPKKPRGISLGPKSKLPIDAKLHEELKSNATFRGFVEAGEISLLNPVH